MMYRSVVPIPSNCPQKEEDRLVAQGKREAFLRTLETLQDGMYYTIRVTKEKQIEYDVPGYPHSIVVNVEFAANTVYEMVRQEPGETPIPFVPHEKGFRKRFKNAWDYLNGKDKVAKIEHRRKKEL